MHSRILLLFVGICGVAAPAAAEIVVTAGHHVLQPNAPGQTISILITATDGEAVHAMDFTAGINGGAGPAPIIAAMDINGAGTLFDANVNPSTVFHFGPGFDPPGLEVLQRVEFDEDDLNVAIGTNQVLGRLVIDTSGFLSGTWSLTLVHTGFDQLSLFSTAGELPVTLAPGSITIVPEPAAWALGCLALAALAITRARFRPRR